MTSADTRPIADWYFDVISPYAYFASLDLPALSERLIIRPRPILFAGLLNHWGQKGPAEIAAKRVWTYQSCIAWAQHKGLPFRLPASHPFNPLAGLRLASAALMDATDDQHAIRIAQTVMAAFWTTGMDPQATDTTEHLARQLGLNAACIQDEAIKHSLRAQTDQAIDIGLFGVPSFRARGQTFWGADAHAFMIQYLDNPDLFDQPEMQQAAALPSGATRPGSR